MIRHPYSLIAKNGYLTPEELAAFSKDLAAGCKVSDSGNEHKVGQQDEALALEDNYPGCTVRSSIADSRVAPNVTKSNRIDRIQYKEMLRPGFEPGISDSKELNTANIANFCMFLYV